LRIFAALTALLIVMEAGAQPADPGEIEEPEYNVLGLKMTAEVVFDGRIQGDRWACAIVELENIGDPVDGMLQIIGAASSTTGERTHYSRPVDIGRKARKRIFLYFETKGWGSEWTVELVRNGVRSSSPLITAPMRTISKEEDDVVLAIVGQDPLGTQVIRETWSGAVPGHPTVSEFPRRRVFLSLIAPENLPDRWTGYNVVDVLVWSQPDPTAVSEEQLAALGQYVGLGGTLVVAVTDRWQLVRDSSLAELLPVELRGAVEATDVDPLMRALELPQEPRRDQTVLVANAMARGLDEQVRAVDGERVLWATREYGLGRVVFLGVDPAMYPVKGGVDRGEFWRRVSWMPEPVGGQRKTTDVSAQLYEELSGNAPNLDALQGGKFKLAPETAISECVHDAAALGNTNFGWTSGYYYGASAIDSWYNSVRQKLVDIPALKPLPLGWILAFALVYLLSIGPVDYLVLRWLGRQEWTWITFPLMIAVFFVAATIGTTAAKGRKAVMTRLEVVDVFEPDGLWRGQSYVGIFASQRASLTLQSQRTQSVVSPMRIVPIYTGYGADPMDEGYMKRPGVQVGRGGGALAYRSDTWTFAYMQSAWVDSHPESHFSLRDDGEGRVTVINGTDVNLHSALLLCPPSAIGGRDTYDYEMGYGTVTPGVQGTRAIPLGPLMAGQSASTDLNRIPEDIQAVWPEVPDRALVRPHAREDWALFREMPDFWGRRGHLDLTRQLLDHKLILVGFTGTPVEDFELKGLDPESEPRTLVRVVLGDDPRWVAPAPPPSGLFSPADMGAEMDDELMKLLEAIGGLEPQGDVP